jgi:hypothetical protein
MFVVDGGQEINTRCAAENAAHSLLCAVDHPSVADGEIYNCGDQDQYTTRQWIELVTDILGAELQVVSIPSEIGLATYEELHSMSGQSSHHLVDTTKLRVELGYADVVRAKDATASYVAWLQSNPPGPDDYPGFIDQFDYRAEDQLYEAYLGAVDHVQREAGRIVPTRAHAHTLAHPKQPGLLRDHGNR